ncbi:MAG: hypothetical protein UT32_C0001G0108 [Parcubacteria group bacterium GW2011_GWC2_39_14]|nr:MAG: hypothetical protein UT32_C0001G0108 [Parcubacteria group bacterium GW2011_GWC2_39_14]KKR55532.1 MAG: hypothetical protein UT91_C0001G0107 [Parcubacteria group bacterium GW2011_GWA2_40_23]
MKVNNFPFGELLKSSWEWTIKNKILWIIAFFAGGGSYFLNMSFSRKDFESMQNVIPNMQKVQDNVTGLWVNSGAIYFVVGLILVFGLLFFLLGLAMRASLIMSNKQLSLNQDCKFWNLVKAGFSYFPRLLLMSVLWTIPNLILLALALVSVFNIDSIVMGIIFICTIFVGVLFNIYVGLLRHNAYCFAILENNTAWNSIMNAAKLLNKNFWVLVVAALIQIGLGIAIGVGLLLVLIAVAIPFVILGGLLMFAIGSAGILVPLLFGSIVVVAVLAALRGGTSFFFNAFLTNVYWEIKK